METNYPDIPYSFFKNKTREVLDILSKMHDISFVWVRLYSIYGPGDKPNNYIPFLVRELKAGRDPELTDQNIPCDYLHVMDASTAIKTIAFSDEIGIFNVGSGKTINTQDVAKIARDKINPNAVLQFGKREKRSVELEYLCADISRLLNLGWRQKMSLEEGIDTI
jgi:nucleoside-diphosphate-sugar epimerase